MKKILLVLSVLFAACSNEKKVEPQKLQSTGNIDVRLGNDSLTSIPYKITDGLENKISVKSFNETVSDINYAAKRRCKHILTYVPKEFSIVGNNKDTIVISIDFEAKNAFGVPDRSDVIEQAILQKDSTIKVLQVF